MQGYFDFKNGHQRAENQAGFQTLVFLIEKLDLRIQCCFFGS